MYTRSLARTHTHELGDSELALVPCPRIRALTSLALSRSRNNCEWTGRLGGNLELSRQLDFLKDRSREVLLATTMVLLLFSTFTMWQYLDVD